ncbi:MAG: RcpC/CpaB family pilus assembly protein [Lactimicrobium sp.]|jgi:Flp pilus assembly protein CpaB|uniref:Flp pilus assembly protein CpaB n=1 Tax=Lactimicrobium sp. TaxID=2563780 RepID=UPI002F354E41
MKLYQKVLLIIGCAILLALLCVYGIRIYAHQQINLVNTWMAAHDIAPRTKIDVDDLVSVKIPAAYLGDAAVIRKEEIIGKYTDLQGKIPAGSLFYKSMLYEETDLPDLPALLLKDGQAVYSMNVDQSDANGLASGQRVNVHVAIERRDGPPLTGALIQNARILTIKDHNGLLVDDPKSSHIPYLLTLAVDVKDIDLLALAETTGKLRLYAGSDNAYNSEMEAARADSAACSYLLSMLETADIQEKGN